MFSVLELPSVKLALLGSLAIAAIFCHSVEATSSRVQGGPAPQSIVFPYWVADGTYGSAVTLNNPTASPLQVNPTLYNASGQALVVPPITLASRDNVTLNIGDWIAAAGLGATFQRGKLVLAFNAPEASFLGAQVSILKPSTSLSFDVPPEMPGSFASSTLEGLWWRQGSTSQATLIVSNAQALPVTATITYAAQGSGMSPVVATVALAAHQTVTIDLNALTLPSKTVATGAGSITLGGIRITHTGVAGAVLAYGMLADAVTGFSAHSQFVDPSAVQSQSLIAPHVMVGSPDLEGFTAGAAFTTIARLRNMSGTAIDVTPVMTFKRTRLEDGTSVTLPVRTLQPQQVDVLDVNQALTTAGVTGPFIDASVRFNYVGQIKALYAQATTVDATGNHAFGVPLKDPGLRMNRFGGSYPWKLDGDYQSVAHLRNTSDDETTVVVQLDFEGGKYTSTAIKMKPQQEVAIDLRKLRDAQVKDGIDRVLPVDVLKGRLTWLENGGEGIVGRMEIYSPLLGISSSFSCAATCCPPSNRAIYISPESLFIAVGESKFVRMLVERQSACGEAYGPFNVTGITTWSVSNSNVLSITPEDHNKCKATCVGMGPAELFGSVPTGEWVSVQNGCHFIRYTDEAEKPVLGFTLTITADNHLLYPAASGNASAPTSTMVTVRAVASIEEEQPLLADKAVELSLVDKDTFFWHTNHTGTRPLGSFNDKPSNVKLTGNLNGQGVFTATFKSSIFCGTTGIAATVEGHQQVTGVFMSVPGLIALDFDNTETYRKYGSGNDRHQERHYGLPDFLVRIAEIAANYKLEVFGPDVTIAYADRLGINDISIPDGGKFEADAPASWCTSCPHTRHRLGRSADISWDNLTTSSLRNTVALIALEFNVRPEIHNGNHFHFVYDQSEE